jgi:hypothetical protein
MTAERNQLELATISCEKALLHCIVLLPNASHPYQALLESCCTQVYKLWFSKKKTILALS